MHELDDSSAIKDPRLKSIRLIELSDHILRLNRRENTQLELRLNQLKRRERIIQRNYDREICWRRLQLAHLYEALHEPTDSINNVHRVATPVSFYAIKMRRNKSAPPTSKPEEVDNNAPSRPNTTSNTIRSNKRAMSIFKEITLKPTYPTLGNMLVLVDNEKQYYRNDWPIRSRTMVNFKKEIHF